MPFLNPKLGIDFTDYIAERTLNFTGRQWVFEAIQNWLAEPKGDRFFLLTGEPGSGKTAITARLTQFAQGEEIYPGFAGGFLQAVHFCSARDSVWADPKEFARSLALQLAQSIPEFGLALKDIGEKTNNINVDLTIGSAQNSDIQGVVIQNLTLSGLTGQEAFTQVVVNPLRQIQQEGFNQPITILVDSLDEALVHDGESTIIDLLSKLPFSIKVRFILTSRDDARVRNAIKGAKRLLLSDPKRSYQNREDIETYVRKRLAEDESLVGQLQGLAVDQRVQQIEAITDKSDGNFLYARFLLDAIANGQCSIIELNGLPQGLDELYYESLARVISLDTRKNWLEDYAPLIGIFLAAQESLNLKQLKAFTGQEETTISSCLNNLRQFLDKIEAEEDEYRIYHQSVADFLGKKSLLIDNEKSENLYYLSFQEQHQRLLKYYCPEDKGWNEVQLEKIDSYGRRHLVQHLVKGDRLEDLHTLLCLERDGKNIWFKVKDGEGELDSYLTELELAWAQADEAYDHKSGKSIGLQCRYALIKASINSLSDIPTKLMVALVKHRLWKPTKALVYARQIPEPAKRCESLIALVEQVDAEPLKEQILHFTLQTALSLQDENHRAFILADLADKLPEVLPQALEAILSTIGKYDHADRLMFLLEKLPEAFPKALDAALAIQNKYDRIEALLRLVDQLPEVVPKALDAALAIQNKELRGQALLGLANKLTPDLLSCALDATLIIEDWYDRAHILKALVEKLTPDLLPKALDAALTIQSEDHRAVALRALAEKSPPNLLPQVLDAALSMQSNFARAWALMGLADSLPEVLPRSLDATLAIQNLSDRAFVLTALAEKLTPDLLPQALDAALAFEDVSDRVKALAALAEKLTPDLLPQALDAALAFEDVSDRVKALAALAGKLTPELLPKVLHETLAIQDGSKRAEVFGALTDKLSPNLLPQALDETLAIQNGYARAWLLIKLADKLPEVLPQALESAAPSVSGDYHDYNRTQVLAALIDKLSPNLLPQALEVALTIQNDRHRDKLLSKLVDKLHQELMPQALEAALAIHDDCDRVLKLTALVDKLPEARPHALAAALVAYDKGYFSSYMHWGLIELADRLPETRFQALDAALALEGDYERSIVLNVLADKLTLDLLPKAVTVAQAIRDDISRASALVELTDKLPEALPKALDAALAIQDSGKRFEKLVELADKLPEALPKALDAALAIQDSGTRFEKLAELADKLPEALPKALDAALAIQDSGTRSEKLAELADKLAPELIPKALNAALDIRDIYHRGMAMTVLADKLTPELLPKLAPELIPKALNAALAMQDNYRVQALIALADKQPALLPKALNAALDIQNSYERAHALRILADKRPGFLPKAVAAALDIQDDYHRAQALIALADKRPELLPKALDAALAISCKSSRDKAVNQKHILDQLLSNESDQHESHRAEILTALADKLPKALPRALDATLAIQGDQARVKALKTLVDKLIPDNTSFQTSEASTQTQGNRIFSFGKFNWLKSLPIRRLRQHHDLPNRYLKAALAIENEQHRVEALMVLVDKPIPALLPKVLEVALTIQNDYDRAQVLARLADKFPEVLPQALEATLACIQDQRELTYEGGAPALVNLIDKLTPDLLPQALAAALAIQIDIYRAEALTALVDKLPEAGSQALKAALEIQFESDRIDYYRTKAAIALADKLPGALPKALEAALAIQHTPSRAEALTALADKLPEALPKALEVALAIQHTPSRAEALIALADKLPEALPKALELALTIQYAPSRAHVLTALADKLPEAASSALEAALVIQSARHRAEALTVLADKLPEALPKALEAALAIQHLPSRVHALTVLANKLPEAGPQALKAARSIKDKESRNQALTELADQWILERISKALEAAYTKRRESDRVAALTALTGELTDLVERGWSEELAKALQAIEYEPYREQVLRVLGDKLPEPVPRVLEAALAVQSNNYRAAALTALVDQFPEVIPNALEAALAIQHEPSRARALRALVNKLTPDLLPQALADSKAIEDKYYRAEALIALADKLPDLLPQALEELLSFEFRLGRVNALTALANKLPGAIPPVLHTALIAALQNEREGAKALADLAETISTDKLPDLLPQVLEAIQAIQDENARVQALLALAPKIPLNKLSQVLEATQTVQNEVERVKILVVLSGRFIDSPDRIILWRTLLHLLSNRTRPELLENLKILTPLIFAFGDEATAETVQAIQDVSRWWP